MYSLATILLIGSAAALALKQHDSGDLALFAAYDASNCDSGCHWTWDEDAVCDDPDLQHYCRDYCYMHFDKVHMWFTCTD